MPFSPSLWNSLIQRRDVFMPENVQQCIGGAAYMVDQELNGITGAAADGGVHDVPVLMENIPVRAFTFGNEVAVAIRGVEQPIGEFKQKARWARCDQRMMEFAMSLFPQGIEDVRIVFGAVRSA